jgi:WD40 repeat protein
LESEFHNPQYLDQPFEVSIFFKSKHDQTISTIDIRLNHQDYNPVISFTSGHPAPIRYIRVHEYSSFLVTIDFDFTAIMWKYDDTDIYDPIVLIKYFSQFFICAGDWLSSATYFIGWTKTGFSIIDPIYSSNSIQDLNISEIPYNIDFEKIVNFHVLSEISVKFYF